MPKYIQVAAHLTPDELEQQYRKAANPVERSHFQIIWLLACGRHARQVAEVTGYCANWIRILARRYNQEGPTTLTDQRQHNSGASPLLSGERCQQLQYLLEQAPPDGSLLGGVRTGPNIARWMGEQLGRAIHPQRGWEYLKRMGFSLQVPRPRHHKADSARAGRRSSASSPNRSDRFSRPIQLPRWSCGRWTSIGWVWVQSSDASGRAEGDARLFGCNNDMNGSTCMGSCIPNRERVSGCCSDRVNIEVFSIALAHFAQEVGAGPDRHIILVARPSQAGMRVGRSSSQRAFISSFSLPTRRNYSRCRTTVAALQ